MWLKVNDLVQVMHGDDKGVKAKVVRIDHESNKVVVEGVNRVYKHVRKSQRNPQGGRLSLEMPINISNVAIICPKCGKPSRMGSRFLDDGSKERFCKKCTFSTGDVTLPKPRRAIQGK
jgi:large subunit ribosomal protein L24